MTRWPWAAGLVLFAAATPGAAAPGTAAEHPALTAADCARIVAHEPAPDVAYRPGVDAEGNAVTPAGLEDNVTLDIDGAGVRVDIAVPLRAVAGIPGDEARFTGQGGLIDRFAADARVGTVTVRDGLVTFNGRSFSSRERELLAAACRDLR